MCHWLRSCLYACQFAPVSRVRLCPPIACLSLSLQVCDNCLLCRILAARAEWLGPDCSALPVFGPWCLERILHTTAAMQPMPHLFFNQAGLLAEPQYEVLLCCVSIHLHPCSPNCSNIQPCELFYAKIGRLVRHVACCQ